jgi:hypothetical protein
MGEVVEFRTKRLTGFIPEQPDGNSKDKQNRAFWKGQSEDTAPSEYRAPDEDGA